jgi:hypothetical protein
VCERRAYLDLADEHWRVVDVGPDGWRVVECPPVRFRRPAGMLPLPLPERGGSIETLNSFLNLASRNDFVLIVAWLLAALRPGGPYPLLAISGEQGSAKTVLSKLLKALVDPNAAPVRALSPAFSAPCSRRWCTAWATWIGFTSSGCRVWPISRSGPRRVKQLFGLQRLPPVVS